MLLLLTYLKCEQTSAAHVSADEKCDVNFRTLVDFGFIHVEVVRINHSQENFSVKFNTAKEKTANGGIICVHFHRFNNTVVAFVIR